MSYLPPSHLDLKYMFCSLEVSAITPNAGIRKIKPLLKQCEDFADSIHILCHADHVGTVIDNKFSIRLIFNIKEPQDTVLIKVSALFAFAASAKLLLINQFFGSE